MTKTQYGIIYKITNTANGKVYIGQTTHSLRDRWRLHCSPKSTCSLLREAIAEFGKEAFVMEQIDTGGSREELNRKEAEWITRENSIAPHGYNVDKGGYSIVYTESAKKRMSDHHADVSGANNPMYGKHHSDESKRLIASRLVGRYTGKDSANHRPVINIDTGERFETATAAAQAYGVTVSTLTKTCRGVQQRTAGHRWAFTKEVV